MKPYLLVLIMAVPMIHTLLASRDESPVESSPAASECTTAERAAGKSTSTTTTTIPAPAAPAAKPAPSSRSVPAQMKPWFM